MLRILMCLVVGLSCVSFLSCGSARASSSANARYLTINASDYPSLQAAIDAIPSTGGTLVINGEFEATAEHCKDTDLPGPCIFHRSNIRILGDGVTSKIYTTKPSTIALQIMGSDLVTVQGVEFSGPWQKGAGGDNGVAVRIDQYYIWPSTRITVQDCRVHNFPFDGLWARNGTSQISFTHNESYDNQGNGIEIEAQDSSVVDNNVHDNEHQGIEIYTAAQNLRVANNRFDRNLVGIKLINDPSYGLLSNISIVGNSASNNIATGILYQAISPGEQPAGLIAITGNTVTGNGDGITLSYAGMGFALTGNLVSSNTYANINITQTSDIVVSNNVLTALPGAPHATQGINVSNDSNRVSLSNNAVDGY